MSRVFRKEVSVCCQVFLFLFVCSFFLKIGETEREGSKELFLEGVINEATGHTFIFVGEISKWVRVEQRKKDDKY